MARPQVPVLGNIPVLGRLFSSESRDETRRNLVIFITARILQCHRCLLSRRLLPAHAVSDGLVSTRAIFGGQGNLR